MTEDRRKAGAVFPRLLIACLPVFLLFFGSFPAVAGEKSQVIIGAGGITGFYYPTAGAICRTINPPKSKSNVRCLVESNLGSLHNLDSLKKGLVDLAIVQSGWLMQAVKGVGPFAEEKPDKNLRAIASLQGEILMVLARKESGVNNLKALKGKRLSPGTKGSTLRSLVDVMFEAMSFQGGDYKLIADIEGEDQLKALCENRVDVAFLVSSHPTPLVMDTVNQCGANVLDLGEVNWEGVLAKSPQLAPVSIRAGTYSFMAGDFNSFGYKTVLASTSALNDDIAYLIAKNLFDNFDAFAKMHPGLEQINRAGLANEGIATPLHEGAARFYKEAGLLK